MQCKEHINISTETISCYLCDAGLHVKCILDAGILSTRWPSKSKSSCSLLESLSSKHFLFKCPACINNPLTLNAPTLNAPTLTATTQTTVTNATYNTNFEDNINTILVTLKSHTQQIQSLMTHNNNLTNKLNNNISHHDTHFTPTYLLHHQIPTTILTSHI